MCHSHSVLAAVDISSQCLFDVFVVVCLLLGGITPNTRYPVALLCQRTHDFITHPPMIVCSSCLVFHFVLLLFSVMVCKSLN